MVRVDNLDLELEMKDMKEAWEVISDMLLVSGLCKLRLELTKTTPSQVDRPRQNIDPLLQDQVTTSIRHCQLTLLMSSETSIAPLNLDIIFVQVQLLYNGDSTRLSAFLWLP